VNITTKRGKDSPEGKVSFLTRNEVGTSSVEHWVPLNQHNPYVLNADGTFALTSAGQRIISRIDTLIMRIRMGAIEISSRPIFVTAGT